MNGSCRDFLRDLGNAFFSLGLWLLRSSRYFVLLLGLGLAFGGVCALAWSNPLGWILSLGGLAIAGLNLGTWNLVGRFTSNQDDG